MKAVFGITVTGAALIVALGVGVSTVLAGDAVVERGGTRLVVPEHYLAKKRFWWIELVQGLDSNAGEALIRVPAGEIRSLLPQGSVEPVEFTSLIHILDQTEADRVAKYPAETANEVNQRKGHYSEQTITNDEATGWYRMYGTYSDTFGWLVIRRQPPIGGDDIVASCVREKSAVVTRCTLPQFVVDGIAVETTIRAEHLTYHERIKQHLVQLVGSWRVK